MARIIDPAEVARVYRQEVRAQVQALRGQVKLVGLLASESAPSVTYAQYTKAACEDVGIAFEIRRESRLELEGLIDRLNDDPAVHGMMVYYPIFANEQDRYLKDLVAAEKDIEGLNSVWVRRLYRNERADAAGRKSILPCTPLAVVKLLEAAGCFAAGERPLAGRTVTIFNRSEVVGRPLASMLANDGARVHSFDEHGALLFEPGAIRESAIKRAAALRESDIVITGVPSRSFPLIQAAELKDGVTCVNFSTLRNFEGDAIERAAVFVPRVGPMTVTMALRNTLRLFANYHHGRRA